MNIVKGKEDEPVQGWANSPWRAIPTAIFSKTGAGVQTFCFVIEPMAAGASPRIKQLESSAGGVRLTLTSGEQIEAQLAPTPAVQRTATPAR